jgi:hypothetical protein
MAQVTITRIGNEYYREYAIEPGDRLITICLRFGQKDWFAIYDSQVNQPFQDRFPDPNQIDFVNPVNLFIPLAGASTSGKSKRGKPVGDYLIARITDENGVPFANEKVRLLGPGLPQEGKEVTTTVNGDVIEANAAAGDWFVVSASAALTPVADVATIIPPREVLPGPPMPVLADPVPLTRNAVDELVARKLVVLRCPMCWTKYAVTVQNPAGTGYDCPHDAFDWTSIVTAIDTSVATFLSAPLPPQDPAATPSTVVCRGVEAAPLPTMYGDVRVFWDESRFVYPDGSDYTLWGTDAVGTVHSVEIVGRHTWGAAAPRPGPGREYKFHTTATGASPVYRFPINNNEVTPLASTLLWITIHHTTDSPSNSFATAVDVQNKHFIDIANTGPGADIGYHFIVDGNGAIYEGRPLGIKGSQVVKWNGGNVGVVLAGDFERPVIGDTPTVAQVTAMTTLIDTLAARFAIQSVWWHQERKKLVTTDPTECPGARLIPSLAALRTKYPGPPP